MDLYHIHLINNHDNLYKENTVFTVNKNFNNRLYKRIYNTNSNVLVHDYLDMFPILEYLPLYTNGKINTGEIVTLLLHEMSFWQDEDWYKNSRKIEKILKDIKPILLNQRINLREMALEEYRRANCNDKPSRLHSLFACSKEGIDYWIDRINDDVTQIFRIETYDEPFLSNENLLPLDSLSYEEQVKEASKYFNPKKRDLKSKSNEYLVQGKVKILERIR